MYMYLIVPEGTFNLHLHLNLHVQLYFWIIITIVRVLSLDSLVIVRDTGLKALFGYNLSVYPIAKFLYMVLYTYRFQDNLCC